MSYYPERINEHFLDPRNVGEVESEDAFGETGSLICGAVVRLSLKIDPASHKITEAKHRTVGCGFLIASASLLTETIKGMVIGEAAHLSKSEVAEKFGAQGVVPPDRMQCVALCCDALHEAAIHYRRTTLEEWTGEEALICTCFGVSERSIERAIAARSLQTVEQVTRACNAGGGCRSCRPLIEDILEDYWRTEGQPVAGQADET
ncbi:MAG: iron-sulfur cluster assembly scaffold protein [Pyrinomonadaceae bacterium]